MYTDVHSDVAQESCTCSSNKHNNTMIQVQSLAFDLVRAASWLFIYNCSKPWVIGSSFALS